MWKLVGLASAPERGAIRGEVAELLGVGAEAVDPEGDLVSQGLDSIRMMSLAGRWRRRGFAGRLRHAGRRPDDRGLVGCWFPDGAGRHSDRTMPGTRGATITPATRFRSPRCSTRMWVGRQDDQRLGGVAGHLYVEFDGGAIDPERLQAAATRLARAIRCCGCSFCPTAPSGSVRQRNVRLSRSPSTTFAT